MLIKNIPIGYSSNEFNYELMAVELSSTVVSQITRRAEELDKLNLCFPDSPCSLSYIPNRVSTNLGDTTEIKISSNGFCVVAGDKEGYVYESQLLPFEALYQRRFLLYFDDDRNIQHYEDGDDIEDFTPIYAYSQERAEKKFLSMVIEVREGFGEPQESLREQLDDLEPQYRPFKEGDVVEEGDQTISIEGVWRDLHKGVVGAKADDSIIGKDDFRKLIK